MRKALFVFFAVAASAIAQTSAYSRDFYAYTRINSPTNGANFSAPATVSVTAEAVLPSGPSPYNFVVTNLSLFKNDSLILSQSGPSTTITANLPLLTAGSYTFYSVAKGIQTTYSDNSKQGWSAVSASVKITVGQDPPSPSGGTIVFKNIGIATSDGKATYNVPIYMDDGEGKRGAGLLSGGVTVGLFTVGGTCPIGDRRLGNKYEYISVYRHSVSIPDGDGHRLSAWFDTDLDRSCVVNIGW